MRAAAASDGISAKSYAGTTGVLLAIDIAPERRDDLLGFAIHRSGGNRPDQFLGGTAHFPGMAHTVGVPTTTDTAPVQRFRWSDYRVFPDTTYSYTVFGAYGDWRKPELREGPTLAVRTGSAATGVHRVLFNRAAAASQAFSREFPALEAEMETYRKTHAKSDPPFPLPPDVRAWLGRGMVEQITGFLARAADPTWALDIAIYEYELRDIIDAVHAARARGARVRIVYHAKPRDEQTAVNEANLVDWPPELKRARVTTHICHDKFIVLSRLADPAKPGVPQAVLCGSTNFTTNGVYRQANVCHIAERDDIARSYAAIFEQLFGGLTPAETTAWINANDPLSADAPLVVGFSPRSGRVDLQLFCQEIARAHRDVMFCTAFDLDPSVLEALLGAPHDDVLRLGLQNSRSKITGFHRDRTAEFSTTAMFNKGLEGMLKESTAGQRGNILIHTKMMLLNFTSDAPTIISGSHNFSGNASGGNDENYLIIRGDSDVADCYGVELLRLYDHYRARFAGDPKNKTLIDPERPCGDLQVNELCPDDRWTAPYFEVGSLKALDRVRFASATG